MTAATGASHIRARAARPSCRLGARIANAAQGNDLRAVRLMLGAGWPVDERGTLGAPIDAHGGDHGATLFGRAPHGSRHGRQRDAGNYVETVGALLDAGAEAPQLTDDLDVDAEIRAALARPSEPR